MKKLLTSIIALSTLGSTNIFAEELDIKVTNLSSAMYFTPILAAAHNGSSQLFTEGESATESLQAMAEGGDISGLTTEIQSMGGDVNDNPAKGLLAPGASTEFVLMTQNTNTHFSLTAMILPTNDGFVGIDSLELPTVDGTYTYYLNAYDAGTEVNNEIINGAGEPGMLGIPGDPGENAGSNGTGVIHTTENSTIHIHRGNLGDTNLTGGVSDLSNTIHRWLNPVAKLTITIK